MSKQGVLIALDAVDKEQRILNLLEAVGMLVLCVHWLRGTFNWLMHTGAVHWPSDKDRENYERLFGDISLYESFIWEIAPPRALLVAMREFRQTGRLREGWESLLNQDSHGRLPNDVDPELLDDIADIMRRLGESRIVRARTEDAQLRNWSAGKNQ